MKTAHATIHLETTDRTDLLDLTDAFVRFVRASGVREGIAIVFVPGSTAGVTTIEFPNMGR